MQTRIPPSGMSAPRRIAVLILAAALLLPGAGWGQGSEPVQSADPPPPQLPPDFYGTGRYIVRDLGVNVSFTWFGKNGDWQMIAGSEAERIHFTNLSYKGYLYTYTYKWATPLPPELLPPLETCKPIDLPLNFDAPRYVGAETLNGIGHRPGRRVHHWRVGVGIGPAEKFYLGPIMEGDVYVDRNDSETIWRVLHFGPQNLYDPAMDEWIVMDTFVKQNADEIKLPEGLNCTPPPPS